MANDMTKMSKMQLKNHYQINFDINILIAFYKSI